MEINLSMSAAKKLERRRVGFGVVPFLESDINSPVVQRVIDVVAKIDGRSRKTIEQQVALKIAERLKTAQQSPKLGETAAKNAAESIAFELLQNAGAPPPTGNKAIDQAVRLNRRFNEKPLVLGPEPKHKFSLVTLNKLVRQIRVEHNEFHQFRSYGRQTSPKRVDTLLIEDLVELTSDGIEGRKDLANITTACADPEGVFYYNKRFMQDLLNFAYLKDLKPNGKKYECNGGPFPDGYAYIEFVVIHEFKHFTMDDFFYQGSIPNANPKYINYVGDFRSNYDLVKAGYAQLPIGLYSDYINLDRCADYMKMYRTVEEEMKKLPPPENEGEGEGEGEGQGQDGQGQGQGKGKPGKGKGKGKGKGQRSLADDLKDISQDDHDLGQKKGREIIEEEKKNGKFHKKSVDDLNKDQAKSGDMEDASEVEPDADAVREQQEKREKGATARGAAGSTQLLPVNPSPGLTWKEVLNKMFQSACRPTIEYSYSRRNQRGVVNDVVGALTGAGAITPVEVKRAKPNPKFCFVINASGSMTADLEKLYGSCLELRKKYPTITNEPFYFFKVVGHHDIYKCSFKTMDAEHISLDTGKVLNKLKLHDVFTKAGGAEDFTKKLADDVIELLEKGYNALIMTDCNISDDNFDQINRMMFYKNCRQTFLIFGREADYLRYRERLQGSHTHITHMKTTQ